jgi:D-glycero-D-manno-heptose 1,7-bisphosphate phosphatase
MSECQDGGFEKIDFAFLDREGVLSRKPPEGQFVTSWEAFELLPGVEEAIARMNRSGHKVILVTNQRCVALGLCSEADVRALHEQLQAHLEAHGARLDAIYFCPHNEGQCNCRKPKTGMFQEAFRDFPECTPGNSVMVGDSLTDIEAATRLGMRSIFLGADPAYQKAGADLAARMATASAASLLECVARYLCIAHSSSSST